MIEKSGDALLLFGKAGELRLRPIPLETRQCALPVERECNVLQPLSRFAEALEIATEGGPARSLLRGEALRLVKRAHERLCLVVQNRQHRIEEDGAPHGLGSAAVVAEECRRRTAAKALQRHQDPGDLVAFSGKALPDARLPVRHALERFLPRRDALLQGCQPLRDLGLAGLELRLIASDVDKRVGEFGGARSRGGSLFPQPLEPGLKLPPLALDGAVLRTLRKRGPRPEQNRQLSSDQERQDARQDPPGLVRSGRHGRSTTVIGMTKADRDAPVDLLQKDHPGEKMRQRHGRQGKDRVSRLPHRLCVPVRAAESERDVGLPPVEPALQTGGETVTRQEHPPFVEHKERTPCPPTQDIRALSFGSARPLSIRQGVQRHLSDPDGASRLSSALHVTLAQRRFRPLRRPANGQNVDIQTTSSTCDGVSICHIFSRP